MSERAPLVLGMDGGGTVTTTWIAEADGRVIGRGSAGPSNIKAIGYKAAMNSLDLSILAAFHDAGIELRPVEVSCLGLAGFDRAEDKEWLKRWADDSVWARRLILVNDGDLVVSAGTPEGWGIAIISGTGSIAVGKTSDGRTARAGGWGFVFGDEGSGYSVAVGALRRIARMADGRDPLRADTDTLTRQVCESLGIVGPDELVRAIYGNGFDRARVARLARAVIKASQEDSTIIDELIRPAAIQLADTVMAVARKLDWDRGLLPLGMGGGFILNSVETQRILHERLAEAGYDVHSTAVHYPVEGALVLARKGLAG